MGPILLLFMTSLLVSTTHQALLRVRPEWSQFFKGESVVLSCEEGGWTMMRNISTSSKIQCHKWGKWLGSTCKISFLNYLDSGVYWCESTDGQTTDSINITVTDKLLLLQSPAVPVKEGQNVSLLCRHKTSSNLPAHFYKDGHFLMEQPTGHMTIPHVTVSDQGLYWCEIKEELSETSWIRITDHSHLDLLQSTEPNYGTRPLRETTNFHGEAPPPTEAPSVPSPVVALICHLVVLCPYIISTVLMVSLYRHRPTE